ncbi:MAG TPA: hypothetical protein VEM35_01120, partial [Rhizomicrobium sp.]|nr:hypothetical protein [Rhizomicrobium sp.]
RSETGNAAEGIGGQGGADLAHPVWLKLAVIPAEHCAAMQGSINFTQLVIPEAAQRLSGIHCAACKMDPGSARC